MGIRNGNFDRYSELFQQYDRLALEFYRQFKVLDFYYGIREDRSVVDGLKAINDAIYSAVNVVNETSHVEQFCNSR